MKWQNPYFGTQDAVRAVFTCDVVACKHRSDAAGGSKEAADDRNAFCPSMANGSKRLDYVYLQQVWSVPRS